MSNNIICAGLTKIRDGKFVTGALTPEDLLTAAIQHINELTVRNEKLLREREELRMFCTDMGRSIYKALHPDASDSS
jgi:hypothetical protein